MSAKKFEILVLNSISQVGLKRFPAEAYRIVKDAAHPDAILVRSHEMNAMKLGMNVLGYDPEITVDAAWSLPSQVKKAHSIEEILKGSQFVTLHVPLLPVTRHLISAKNLELMHSGTILLNFSREEIVDAKAVAAALASKKLKYYVTDFPAQPLCENPAVIALPHLGASTREAEDNSAVMVVDQVREYLENGN